MDTLIVCASCGKQLDATQNFCPACGTDVRGLSPSSDTLSGPWSGKVIDGRYRVIEKLGEGGMGSVYKVEHVRMEKMMALKLLRSDLALDKSLKNRFMQEARLVAKLSHPNTMQVFDHGEEGESLYIAMEYLPGRDLAWHLRAHGPMAEERALNIGVQVLASLEEAHQENVVHRDIKPANVMLVRKKNNDEQVKLLDFGIAKLLEGEGRRSITGSAEFIGTPAYMSPEQARGDSVDARSDLYSVGILLFELVCGRPPFEDKNPMATVKHHLATPVPRVHEVNPERPVSAAFEAVLKKALAKDAKERFQSAEEMRAALEKVRRELGALSTDFTPLPDDTREFASRRDFDSFERRLKVQRTIAPLVAVAALLAAAVWGVQLYRAGQPGRAAPTGEEREPNEKVTQATRIALGAPVVGRIGAADEGQGDQDVYVVDVPAGRAGISLSGVSDLNLVLQVAQFPRGAEARDADAQHFVDDAPTHFGERLDALEVAAGPLYVRVYERAPFSEAARPPRERARADYQLQVDAAPDEPLQPMEAEPNDTLNSAEKAPLQLSLQAFAGAVVEYPPDERRRVAPSSVDWFEVQAAEEDKVAVLVVPPPEGALCVVDGAAYETWTAKRLEANTVSGRTLPEPKCQLAKGTAALVALKPTHGLRLVRVQALDADAAHQPYRLAFVTGGSNGLAAVMHLARALEAEGRMEVRKEAVETAASEFSDAPQVADLKALIR